MRFKPERKKGSCSGGTDDSLVSEEGRHVWWSEGEVNAQILFILLLRLNNLKRDFPISSLGLEILAAGKKATHHLSFIAFLNLDRKRTIFLCVSSPTISVIRVRIKIPLAAPPQKIKISSHENVREADLRTRYRIGYIIESVVIKEF